MNQLRRRLFATAASLSLAFFIVILAAWIHMHRVYPVDLRELQRESLQRSYGLSLRNTGVAFERFDPEVSEGPHPDDRAACRAWMAQLGGRYLGASFAGFEVFGGAPSMVFHHGKDAWSKNLGFLSCATVPYWFLLLLSLPPPILWAKGVRRERLRNVRRGRGLCLSCGYDLLCASPDLCPECGTVNVLPEEVA